jgi:hypothetical protein
MKFYQILLNSNPRVSPIFFIWNPFRIWRSSYGESCSSIQTLQNHNLFQIFWAHKGPVLIKSRSNEIEIIWIEFNRFENFWTGALPGTVPCEPMHQHPFPLPGQACTTRVARPRCLPGPSAWGRCRLRRRPHVRAGPLPPPPHSFPPRRAPHIGPPPHSHRHARFKRDRMPALPPFLSTTPFLSRATARKVPRLTPMTSCPSPSAAEPLPTTRAPPPPATASASSSTIGPTGERCRLYCFLLGSPFLGGAQPGDHAVQEPSVSPPRPRHRERRVRSAHAVPLASAGQEPFPRWAVSLGWNPAQHCSPFFYFVFWVKITENSFKILKFMENGIKLKKYEINFHRIQLSISLQWAWPNSYCTLLHCRKFL